MQGVADVWMLLWFSNIWLSTSHQPCALSTVSRYTGQRWYALDNMVHDGGILLGHLPENCGCSVSVVMACARGYNI